MENVLISKCCLGVPCRHHGRQTVLGSHVKGLIERYNLIPICPEVLGGLSTPRPPCYIPRGGINKGKVFTQNGKDVTKQYIVGAKKTLTVAKKSDVHRFYGLKNSPSCGKDYGITAKLLKKNDISVFSV